MAIDTILFVDLLGMTMYPGSPFTGILVRDLIMFFFIPTVFIIVITYTLVGRIYATHQKIRLLMGVAIYLFIIAGGYYNAFALLAGPYFIFLIFALGLVYFIPTHFRIRTHGLSRGSYGEGKSKIDDASVRDLLNIGELNPARASKIRTMIKKIDEELSRLNKRYDQIIASGGNVPQTLESKVQELEMERKQLKERLEGGY